MAKKLFNKKKNFNKTFKSAVEAEKYNEEMLTVAGVEYEAERIRLNKAKEEVLKKAKILKKNLNELASQDSTWEVIKNKADEITVKKGNKEWKAYMDGKAYIHANKPDNSIQLKFVGMDKPGVALSEVKFVMPTEVAQIILDGYAVGDENIFNKMQQLGISFIGINPVDNPEPVYAPIKHNPFAEEDKGNWEFKDIAPAPVPNYWGAEQYGWFPISGDGVNKSAVKGNAHDEIKQKAKDALQKQASKEFNNNDLDKEIKKSFEAVEDLINFMPMPQGVIPDIYTSSPKIEAEAKAKESLWDSNEWKDIEAEAKRLIDKIGSDKPEWRKAQLDKLEFIKKAEEERIEDAQFLKALSEIGEDDDKFTTGFSSIDKAIKEGNGDNFLLGSAPKATQKQLNYLKKLGWNGDVPTTQSEASKLITKLVGKDNGPGPTLKQLNYLAKLGYTGDTPETKKEASALIDSVKSEMSKNIRREDRFYPE